MENNGKKGRTYQLPLGVALAAARAYAGYEAWLHRQFCRRPLAYRPDAFIQAAVTVEMQRFACQAVGCGEPIHA